MTANEVLAKYWGNRSYPVNPFQIAEMAGIVVDECNLAKESLSGIYLPAKNGKPPIIKINKSDSMVRKRFTLSHELGHHFLKHGARNRIDNTDMVFKDDNSSFSVIGDAIEMQANSFAAQLLMPVEFLNYIMFDLKITDSIRIAKMLNVSQPALHYRSKNLGII